MPIEGPSLNGLRGFVRPRRIGLAPRMFDEATDTGRLPVSSFEEQPTVTRGLAPPTPPVAVGLPAGAVVPTSGIPTRDLAVASRPMGEMERAFTAQTPQEQNYQNLQARGPADPKAGVWERIKGALLSGALAAREAGNQNPEAQGAALLGGLVGGGVSRGFAGNMRHNLVDLPRAKGLAAESRDVADAGLGRRMGFAKTFGYDPQSGANTAATDQYENERTFRDEQAKRAQETNVLDKLIQGHLPITEQVGGKYGLTGVTAPFPPSKPLPPAWHLDANNNYVNLNAAPPGVKGRDPNAITPYQKEKLRLEELRVQQGGKITPYQQAHLDHLQKQESTALDKEAKGLAGEFEKTKKAVTLAATEWGQMEDELHHPTGKDDKGKPMSVFKGKAVTQAEVDAKKAEAEALQAEYSGVKQRVSQHPNLGFDSSGEGIVFKSGRSAGSQAGAPAGKASSTVTQERYDEQVRKHGKEATDAFMAKNGLTIQ